MQKIGISETLFREAIIDESLNKSDQIEVYSAFELINECMMILEGYQAGIQCPASILDQVIKDCKEWSQTNIETIEL